MASIRAYSRDTEQSGQHEECKSRPARWCGAGLNRVACRHRHLRPDYYARGLHRIPRLEVRLRTSEIQVQDPATRVHMKERAGSLVVVINDPMFSRPAYGCV